jgi:hypothetical protein
MPLAELIAHQEEWARHRWRGHSSRRAPSLRANLFVPMSRDVRLQFTNGSGSELGHKDKPGKMQSLRSSSALSYNVFAPWIASDLQPLARALGVKLSDGTMRFERQFRHGLNSMPPNIDVALDNDQRRPLGIESKFTEPYGPKKDHPPLDQKYFVGNATRWADLDLPRCQDLAASIGTSLRFKRLGVGQLVKHILGLAWTTKSSPRLMYVWYDSGCNEANEHRDELARFRELIDSAIDFSAQTYQDVFAILLREREPVRGYHSYLRRRYFAA